MEAGGAFSSFSEVVSPFVNTEMCVAQLVESIITPGEVKYSSMFLTVLEL